MNEAPERIWLLPFDGEQRCWCDDPDPSGLGHEGDATEYVRADVVDAMRATLREISGMARDAREARAATARIALGMLANLAEAAAKGGD